MTRKAFERVLFLYAPLLFALVFLVKETRIDFEDAIEIEGVLSQHLG